MNPSPGCRSLSACSAPPAGGATGGNLELRTEVRDSRYPDWCGRSFGRGRQRVDHPCGRRRPAVRYRISRRCSVKFRRLDVVVLERDLPAHGLKRGDLGAVVELYEPDGLEVEFVTASGRT